MILDFHWSFNGFMDAWHTSIALCDCFFSQVKRQASTVSVPVQMAALGRSTVYQRPSTSSSIQPLKTAPRTPRRLVCRAALVTETPAPRTSTTTVSNGKVGEAGPTIINGQVIFPHLHVHSCPDSTQYITQQHLICAFPHQHACEDLPCSSV